MVSRQAVLKKLASVVKKRKKTTRGIAKKALSLAKKNASLHEMKNKDLQGTVNNMLVAPVINELTSAIPAGDGNGQRDGDDITIVKILLRYVIAGEIATESWGRVMLIQDTRTQGLIYAAGNVLKDVTVADGIISPLNVDFAGRFKILHNKVHLLNGTGRNNTYTSVFLKTNIKIRFKASTPALADMLFNSMSLMFLGSESVGGDEPHITWFIRLWYQDS